MELAEFVHRWPESRPGALNHEAQLLLTLNAIPDYGQYGFQEFTFQD